MHDHIAVIHNNPAIARFALLLALFVVLGADSIHGTIGQSIQHAVTGTVADDKVIGKICDFFDVEQ